MFDFLRTWAGWFLEQFLRLFQKEERHSDYGAFEKRLKASKLADTIPERLAPCISLEEVKKVLDYVWDFGLTDVKHLKAGEAYRYDKTPTRLPRTFQIVRTLDGEFQLILDTKSKINDGSKRKIVREGGAYKKSPKPAWRLDGAFQEYFSLVVHWREEKQTDLILKNLRKEIKIPYQLNSPFVEKKVLGALIAKSDSIDNPKFKMTFYGVRVYGDLMQFIVDGKLKAEMIDGFILDLLQGLKVIHDNHIIFQDMKPENILVCPDPVTETYRLEYTDFGLSHDVKKEYYCFVNGSAQYQSPEFIHAHSKIESVNPKQRELKAALLTTKERFLSLDHYRMNTKDYTDEKLKVHIYPHTANDMWGLGMIIFYLKHNKPATADDWGVINEDPLLKGLFNPDRNQRLTIDEALNMFRSPAYNEQLKQKSPGIKI